MRRFLLITAVLITLAFVSLLLALRSQTFVLGAAHWAVAAFTDLRLELHDAKVDVYRGELSAAGIHLVPASIEGPPLLSILDFSGLFRLPGMPGGARSGSALRASAVTIYTSDSDRVSEPAPMQWLGYLRWLPSELDIAQLHLINASTSTRIFPLKHLRGGRVEQGNYRLAAEADYEGEPLGITVEVLAVNRGWGVTAADAKIALIAPESDSEVTLAGTLEGTDEEFEYNFAINAYYREIHELLKGFDSDNKLRGALRLQGTLEGDARSMALSDTTFLLDNTPEYAFQASGSLTYQLAGESTIALEALGEIASLASVMDWTGLNLGDFGRVKSSIRLSGSLDKPVVDAFSLTTDSATGLALTMAGQLDLFELDADTGAGAKAIDVELKGPSIAALENWLGKLPYDPGPWRAAGQLSGGRGDLSLRNLVVETGAPGALEMRASGTVGRIRTGRGRQEKITADDIALTLQASVPDSAKLNTLLGRTDIPSQHEVTASILINGNSDEMQLSAGQIVITASDLTATIGPLSAVLRPADDSPLSELAAPLVARVSDTAALSPYSSLPMPVLGPLNISARLAQNGEVLQLLDVLVAIGEGEPVAEARGRIDNLATFSDVVFTGKLSAVDNAILFATLLPDFSSGASLGRLKGTFKLTERKGSWTLSQLALEGGDATTPVSFTVQGEVRDLTGLTSADLAAQFRLVDAALLESISGRALKPLSGSLAVATAPGAINSTLKALVGETEIRGDARVTLGEKRVQGVTIALETQQLRLEDFGFVPTQSEDTSATDSHAVETPANTRPIQQGAGQQEGLPEPQPRPGLMALLRENSPPFPVDISVRIDGFSGDSSKLDSLNLKISGTDGRYTLEQFSFGYQQALAEIRGVIDLNPAPPAMSLAGQANAFPLSAILRDIGIATNVSGALTILGGVTAMGETADALVSSINGSVALALENAVIEGAAYDLLATDLLAWIYSGALTETSTHIDCTMARFDLRDGIATTESLYIESARMVASGRATFDLVKRRMDLRLTPLSKSRLLQVPSRIRLKGDMRSPKAEISPVAAVADATSSALMLIPELTLKLFGVNQSATRSYRPCQAELGN